MNEDENYQALSDLMTAMLFVFIITLIAYIINFSSNKDLAQSLGQQMSDLELKKSYIIRTVSDNLLKNGIRHEVNIKGGTISISSDQLGFTAGQHNLESESISTISKVSASIDAAIKCEPQQLANTELCIDGFISEIDHVFVEGHTDNVPFRARNGIRNNVDLSLLRAASVKQILDRTDDVVTKTVAKVFVPVGYGDTQPLVEYSKPTDDAKNRRIDFRFSLKKPWEHSQ